MDEARVGQKGRTTHRWWVKGQRPPGVSDKCFESAYTFAAVRPATGEDFALVLQRVSAEGTSTFLAEFGRSVWLKRTAAFHHKSLQSGNSANGQSAP